ncbi:4-amino-4-deoxy-L-arabinose-phosphoundecaprenol flippase subunit ArnF [Roseovarius litorisediminis]|uniref:4-amino-4-deoxy-L-arabinose-phosphoundecaprenol flippase subunit ArnF n=1 Tax=Roseovarius litorisediminis TaxID=1312363 RepID=A0A1Y5T0C2_9RHOB|nr:hypothetical protein [Roseovarius litorisediminis]SLN52967.1 4-amino-4-deoxy-L-arabinose-phosphoundecaprenol flippase subunit ArnF [Roseovarius litorisediminis]
MNAFILGFGYSLITAVIVILGDTILKIAADGGMPLTSRHVLAGCALYGISAIMWYFAMCNITLAQGGMAYSMLSLIALCVISTVCFNEPLGNREVMGISCALLSMVLMVGEA